jgi:hypothetical protein
MSAARVAARAAAAQRGRSRSGPARGREDGGKAGEDAWHASERLWSGGARHMAGAAAAGRRREETEEGEGR